MIKRGKEDSNKAIHIVLKELKNKKKEDLTEFILLFLALISTSTLFIILSINLITTGFATYLPAQAGYISEFDVNLSYETYYWHGLYGLALRVPGYEEQIFDTLQPGEITNIGLFFDCMQLDAVGGREVYASLSPIVEFNSLVAGTTAQVDSFLNCVGANIDCASNTFTKETWFMVGSNNITEVPSTHTYKFDGDTGIFDLGVLYDGSNLVYVTHVNDIQKGYSPNSTVNFQMLLPVPPNSSQTYYFFTDPNDNCVAGGTGEVLLGTVYGYVRDPFGIPVPDATVSLGGNLSVTDAQGFYNLSMNLVPGIYNLIATKTGYAVYATNVSLNFTNSSVEQNITLTEYVPGGTETIKPIIEGYVWDTSGIPISDVNVSLAGETYTTSLTGYYNISPTIVPEPHPIIAIKEGYNNYYHIIPFNISTNYLSHNITLESVYSGTTNNPYATGPYTSQPRRTIQQIRIEAKKNGEDFWISSKEIIKEVRKNTFVEETLGIYNFETTPMNIVFTLSPELSDFVKLNRDAALIGTNSGEDLILTIYGTKPIGTYEGKLSITGSINKDIPIKIRIVENRVPVETLLMKLDLFEDVVSPGKDLQYKLLLQNLLRDQNYKIELEKKIMSENDSQVYFSDTEQVEIDRSLSLLDRINIPENFSEGKYILKIEAKHLNLLSSISAPFTVRRPLYLYSFFGIPLWIFFLIISFASFIALNLFIYKKYKEKQKRYRISLDRASLPKPDKKNLRIGLIAETKDFAYLEPDKMKTHTIVAGATGMGKSISAQVLIEEALLQNVAVIIFDPTAQWSGMLRKCEDKKMIALYPKFGLKPSDARGFPGNIKQITDAREIIEINKYINPGQVQILALNKLDPKDIDTFIANMIRQIFKSDPKETPDLKLLLVFDEVHRLLSKFGGSGEGFLQIERACREFRKWGMGVILISQVLSDFVGEVKANINTEIQTRTIEESDLERIKTKYGEEFLKSLVRTEVGVAMFQNAEYNKGKPYFVNFRPILHNTRRLPDEELEKYNTYNELVEDMEYQVEQLEQLKIDVFDLKMELKLIKDKIMTGNFSVVDIYLEGLKPRLQKQWEKLGKTPKKKQKLLADISEIKKAVEEAKKARAQFEKEEANKAKASSTTPSSTQPPSNPTSAKPILKK